MDRKEALEIVRKNQPKDIHYSEALHTLIPELKESEDERIRRDVITTLSIGVSCEESALHPGAHTTLKEAIFWLEKQGEQKPTWSEEDKISIDEIIETLNIVQANRLRTQRTHYSKATIDKDIAFLKSLKGKFNVNNEKE